MQRLTFSVYCAAILQFEIEIIDINSCQVDSMNSNKLAWHNLSIGQDPVILFPCRIYVDTGPHPEGKN